MIFLFFIFNDLNNYDYWILSGLTVNSIEDRIVCELLSYLPIFNTQQTLTLTFYPQPYTLGLSLLFKFLIANFLNKNKCFVYLTCFMLFIHHRLGYVTIKN